MEKKLSCRNISKTFGPVTALRDVSFDIFNGEIYGLLGPNGAGKTTLIKIFLSLISPDRGEVNIGVFQLSREKEKARQIAGWAPQETALDPLLTGRELLQMASQLYRIPRNKRDKEIKDLLELLDLGSAADRIIRNYSGGMKKKLDLAFSLIHRPQVLFLDEPTLGLDIQTRRKIWEYIENFRAQGTTILLTTHYLEEADKLCDRLAIIDKGEIKGEGPPEKLKKELGTEEILLRFMDEVPQDKINKFLADIQGEKSVLNTTWKNSKLKVKIIPGSQIHVTKIVLSIAEKNNCSLEKIDFQETSLDDVFLSLTGFSLPEKGGENHE